MRVQIEAFLYKLGLNPVFKDFFYLADVLELALSGHPIDSKIFHKAAERSGVSYEAVYKGVARTLRRLDAAPEPGAGRRDIYHQISALCGQFIQRTA